MEHQETGQFDPYLTWLDIGPQERPLSYYRLLGLRPRVSNAAAIAQAADRVLRHLRQFTVGEHAAACRKLMAEVESARMELLDPARRERYDARLNQPSKLRETQIKPPPPVPGNVTTQTSSSATAGPVIRPAPQVPGPRAAPAVPTLPTGTLVGTPIGPVTSAESGQPPIDAQGGVVGSIPVPPAVESVKPQTAEAAEENELESVTVHKRSAAITGSRDTSNAWIVPLVIAFGVVVAALLAVALTWPR